MTFPLIPLIFNSFELQQTTSVGIGLKLVVDQLIIFAAGQATLVGTRLNGKALKRYRTVVDPASGNLTFTGKIVADHSQDSPR